MKIKIITGISLIIFAISMTALFTYGIVSFAQHKEKQANDVKKQLENNKRADASAQNDPALNGVLTIENVALHSKATDCWLIIETNVYDVTSFIGQHPGGSALISKYCGQDATNNFDSRDRNPAENHSSFARNLLRSYYIGPLGRVPNQIVFPINTNQNQLSLKTSTLPLAQLTPLVPNKQNNLLIDLTEVSKHSTLQNCWLVISNKVYDITSFIVSHPGGQPAIAPYCGKEATTAFQNKGGNGNNHSSYAYSLLNNYLIATLGSTVAVSSNNIIPTAIPTTKPATATIVPTSIPQNQNLTLTVSAVSTHNTLQNCWLIISNNVYDVTRFISQHPGGVTALTNYCGKEATSAFQTRGGTGNNHSSYAYSLLNQYLIGSIGSSVPINPTTALNPTPTTVTGGTPIPTNTPVPSTGCSSNVPSVICTLYSGSTVTLKSGERADDGSWEGEVLVNGSCRHIKINSSNSITSNQSC